MNRSLETLDRLLEQLAVLELWAAQAQASSDDAKHRMDAVTVTSKADSPKLKTIEEYAARHLAFTSATVEYAAHGARARTFRDAIDLLRLAIPEPS